MYVEKADKRRKWFMLLWTHFAKYILKWKLQDKLWTMNCIVFCFVIFAKFIPNTAAWFFILNFLHFFSLFPNLRQSKHWSFYIWNNCAPHICFVYVRKLLKMLKATIAYLFCWQAVKKASVILLHGCDLILRDLCDI